MKILLFFCFLSNVTKFYLITVIKRLNVCFRLERLFLYTAIGWLLLIRPTTYGKDSFSLPPSFSLEGGLAGKLFIIKKYFAIFYEQN